MCEECGCNEKTEVHEVNSSLTAVNDTLARIISETLSEKKVFCVNLMGSPGSGKTSVIEGIAGTLSPDRVAVIQGDLESDIDKKRLEALGIQTVQINTHSGCHLDAVMVNRALLGMDLENKQYLIIENVGNLVCPAGVKIGQHLNIVVSSTTEGQDKPKKYPYIFMDASIIVISKTDLTKPAGFDEQKYLDDLRSINPKATVVRTSTLDKTGFSEVATLIRHKRDHLFGTPHQHENHK